MVCHGLGLWKTRALFEEQSLLSIQCGQSPTDFDEVDHEVVVARTLLGNGKFYHLQTW